MNYLISDLPDHGIKSMPKVFKVLGLLSKKDYKQFLKLLRSPYLNTNNKLTSFAEYLYKFFPEFEHKELTKERMDAFLFPGTAYNRKRITDYLSDLNKKLELFLKIETLNNNEALQKRVLINAFDSPGFYDLFYKELKRNSEALKDGKVKGPNKYREIAVLGERLLFHPEYIGKKKDEENEVLMDIMEHLDMDFAFSKLRLMTFIQSKREFLTTEFVPKFNDEIMELSAKEFSKVHIGFKIYLELIALQKTSGDCVLFNKVADLFISNVEMLSVGDLKNLFICLANYCVKSINLNLEGFSYAEMMKLYDSALEKGILIYNGQLSDSTFNNVVIAAIKAGKFEYANNFIEDYQQYLGENIRVTAVQYCKAIICYNLKQYDEAIDWLNGANKHFDIRYKIQWRFLFVKIYFEKNISGGWTAYELLESFLDSFSVFLRRNEELSANKKTSYLDFVRFTKQLMKIYPWNRYDSKDLDKLRGTISNSNTQGKTWLLEQLIKAE